VRLLLAVLGRLPARVREALSRGIARLAFALGIRRRVVLQQLAWAFQGWTAAEVRAVARRTYASLARAGLEALLAQQLEPEVLAGSITMDDDRAFERALEGGRGLLIVTAHFGSWEHLGEAVARRGLPLSAVARPLKGAFNAELVASRVRSGLRLIAQRGALRGTLAALRRNEAVTVLLDQAIGGKHALFVPFFGRPAATTPLVSMAALQTGAPVLVALAARDGGSLHLRIQGPFPVPSTGDRQRDLWTHTAALTEAIETAVRARPDQWLWLHRRWKLAPPPAEALRLELLALAADDARVRARLASDGSLFQGYAPEMEAIHRRNAARLAELVDAHGWPGRSRAGDDGAEAAWLIVQHAVGDPALQRRCLSLLEAAAASGEVPPLQPAMLDDRIRFFEGRPQLYGTTLDWDEQGRLTPGPLEAPAEVDARRAALGLPPLEVDLQRSRAGEGESLERPPTDPVRRRSEFEAWARRVGWRM
jgi:KDO2-lipid IV(A) lauroyltransferase